MWRRVWIWKRRLRAGRVYCIRWHDDEGRMRTETAGPDLKLAERLRYEREHQLNEGSLKLLHRVSYEEFVREELEVMKGRIADDSIADIGRVLTRFGGRCGVKMLVHVTTRAIEDYFSWRLGRVEATTANKDLRVLKASFNRAVKRGYLAANPACDVKQVREPEKTMRVLSDDEIAKLLAACPSLRWRVLVALGVTTGMRRGEMLALRWQDVDLEDGTVWVRNSDTHLTKSRRNRVLALLPEVCQLLERIRGKSEFVFNTLGGGLWRNNLQRDFAAIVKRASIEHCTLHDLRRTFVSHLAMAGVNEAVVQKLAGHSSVNTTIRYYTQIMPQSLRAAQHRLSYANVVKDVSDTYHGPFSLVRQKTA